MKKWLKEKQQQEADSAPPGSVAAASAAAGSGSGSAPTVPVSEGGGRKRGKAAAANSTTAQQERERMLVSLEGFRNSIAAAGVSLGSDAAAALEGIMIGELPAGAALPAAASTAGVPSSWRDERAAGGRDTRSSAGYPAVGSAATRSQSGGAASSVSGAISHDECAHQLVEMLHLLKKAPAVGGMSEPQDSSGSSSADDEEDEDNHSGVGYSGSGSFVRGERDAAAAVSWGDPEDDLVDFAASTPTAAAGGSMLSSHLQRVEQLRKRKRGDQGMRRYINFFTAAFCSTK